MKKLFLIFFIANLHLSINAQESELFFETIKISENMYEICVNYPGNSVNVYVFKGKEGTLLIDTGMDTTAELLKGELEKIGVKNLKYVVNTHNDWDHTLGNNLFGEDAVIIAHKNCRNILVNDVRIKKNGTPDIAFQDSMSIFLNGEEIILRYIPGHTNNDVYLEFKKTQLLFMGDMMFDREFPVIHASGDLYKMIKNLKNIRSKYPSNTTIYSGHGEPTTVARIDAYLDLIEKTKDEVVKAIGSGIGYDEFTESKRLNGWLNWKNNQRYLDRWIAMLYNKTDEGKAKSAAYNLGVLIDKHGCKKAYELFNKTYTNGEYCISERNFNSLGYGYIYDEKIDEAVLVFKINVELNPESANAYDSLGEAYMLKGNKELAIKYYKKSVDLNPNNTYAKKVIDKLESEMNEKE